jgi:transposase
MSRNLNFTLTDEEQAALEQAITGSPLAEVRQRAIAIRLLHLGQSPQQVAEAVLVTSNTIYAWHKRWREGGVAGLRDGHRTGRPAKADATYKALLNTVLEQDPRDLGLAFTIWTIDRLRVYLSEQTGILLSYSRFRALLTREGYRWKEPKHDLSHLQDRPVQETIEQVTAWLKKTSRSTRSPKLSSSLWTKRR